MKPLVYVIVVNWNGIRYLRTCLNSLLRQEYPNLRILLIDNGSSDGSIGSALASFPKVEVISNRTNLGFARAANQGIDCAVKRGADYILILNNDIVLPEKSIETLVYNAESKSKVGIVGPKILRAFEANVIQDIGFTCDFMCFPHGLYSGIPDTPEIAGPREVFGVSACAMLIKTDVLKRVDPFDPDYFIFMEDVDLCWRTQLAGFRVLAVADTIAYHIGGAAVPGGYLSGDSYETTVSRTFLRERNSLATILKNYSMPSLCWVLPIYSLFMSVELSFFALVEPQVSLSYMRALLWNLIHLRRIILKRRRVQSSRKIRDSQMLGMMSKKPCKILLYARVGIPRFAKR